MLVCGTHHLRRSLISNVRKTVKNGRFLSLSSIKLDTFRIQDAEDFQKNVMENSSPVIVDFSATWCGPCKLLTPRLDSAIAATEGKVHLAIVDIDDLGELAMDHNVQAVPTVIAIKNGQVQDKFVGLLDEDKLGAFINKLVD